MKKLFAFFAAFVVALLIPYAGIAFFCWELNPGKWSEPMRFCALLWMAFLAVILACIANDNIH